MTITQESRFKPMAFGIHSHSDYSLDGGSSPKSKLQRAIELGRPADSLTDHGIMSGLVPHWFAAKELSKTGTKIQSIHGIELYVIDEDRPKKVYKNGKEEWKYSHLTILFKTRRAYEYMCSMTPVMEERALVKFGERKPLIFLKELEPISGEIIIGTGCAVGYVTKNINDWSLSKTERREYAERAFLRIKELSGSTPLLLEIMPHKVTHNWSKPKGQEGFFYPILEKNHICSLDCAGLEHQSDHDGCTTLPVDLNRTANQFILEMKAKYGGMTVISEDSHFSRPEDAVIQAIRLGNGEEKWKFYNSYHCAPTDEWADSLKSQLGISDRDIEEMVDNSYMALDEFKDYSIRTNDDGWLVPTAEMVYGISSKSNKEILTELIAKHGLMPKPGDPKYQIYKDRLDYEISIFADNGIQDLLPYFFPIEDISNFCRDNESLINVRGSIGGSLITYLLRISVTDPIVYDLPVERAITVGRIKAKTMVDADVDTENRDFIIDYLKGKYGDRIALISTELQLKLKGSILDVERATDGDVSEDTARMAKSLPDPPQGVNYHQFLFGYNDKDTGVYVDGFLSSSDSRALILKAWGQKYPEKWSTVLKCLGITKTRGVHAGGVLIMPDSVQKYMPVMKNPTKGWVGSLNMKYAENIGGIKYDILGVETLRATSISMKLLKKRGISLEWGEFPHDEEVYKSTYHAGKLCGLFQVDTPTMRPFVLKMRPKSINEISNIISLVRPGALDAASPRPGDIRTAASYYASCAVGDEQTFLIHPALEPILGYSYGVCLHQEQLLRSLRDLADYSYEDAEDARRGVGKKIKEVVEKHMGNLKKACVEKHGFTDEQAQTFTDMLLASARYSFNRAHSTSYAIVSYNGAWLKHHYPLEFWIGILTIGQDDSSDLKHYLSEAGDLVLPVDVIASHPTDWTIEGTKIRPPLSLLKGVGGKSVHALRTFINTPYDLLSKELFDDISKDEEVVTFTTIDPWQDEQDIEDIIANKQDENF